MRWFKMFTDEHESLEAKTIIAEYGVAGYGRYVLLLELMMRRVENSEDAFALVQSDGKPIPLSIIADTISYKHLKDCRKFLNFLASLGTIDEEQWKSRSVVSKQNLRKRADNYTIQKSSQKTLQRDYEETSKQEEEGEAEEEQKEKEKSTDYTPKPCDVLEVIDYACSIELTKSDAEAFFDFYTSKGWKVGKTAMKDWHAALRNWKRNKGTYAHHHSAVQQRVSVSAAPGSQQARATYRTTPESIEQLRQAFED
jgi:hypothetical protein